MANKKSYHKYAATTMAAAVAVTAVAPVVAAAETPSYTDVSPEKNGVHYDAIIELTEREIFTGSNGEFNPFEDITRLQVAYTLARYNELPTPSNVDEILADFSDIDSSWGEDAEVVAAVVEAGIFGGNNGEFNAGDDIYRVQMAKVLVEAFDLADINPAEDTYINLDNIDEESKDYVQILANLGITTEVDDFRPWETVPREQFATFLKRAIDVVEAEEEVEEVAVQAVSAITPNSVELEINASVDELSRNDVVVTNSKGERQYIKSVEVVNSDATVASADKTTTIKVEFYDDLKSGDTYTFAVNVNGETVKSSIDFEIADVAEIQIEEQVVSTTKPVVTYKVFDENGLDLTANVEVKLSSDKSSSFSVNKGEIKATGLGDGDYAFVELSYDNKDGEKVTSKRVKVTAEDPKAVNSANEWTLTETQSESNYKADDFEQDTTLNMGDSK